jgi:hypothetical protein
MDVCAARNCALGATRVRSMLRKAAEGAEPDRGGGHATPPCRLPGTGAVDATVFAVSSAWPKRLARHQVLTPACRAADPQLEIQ